jgi:hypothetical protein
MCKISKRDMISRASEYKDNIRHRVKKQYMYHEKNEMGGACSSDGEGERRVQVFGGETWGKKITGETRCRWEDNVKLDLQEVWFWGYGMDWAGSG